MGKRFLEGVLTMRPSEEEKAHLFGEGALRLEAGIGGGVKSPKTRGGGESFRAPEIDPFLHRF